jgi:serine/threonine-protein kinase
VVVKVLPAAFVADPERRARFLRDAAEAAAVCHRNIAQLHEVVEGDGRLAVVFDFVPGENLRALMAGRPLNPRRAVEIAAQLADALADAHAQGVVHGDVRAENVIVTPKGIPQFVDFGLSAWTAAGAARIARDSRPADESSDLQALGVLLFEMLTGVPPSPAAGPPGALEALMPPGPGNRSLPPEARPILAKALASRLEGGYETAAVFAAELRALAAVLDVRAEAGTPQALARPVEATPPRLGGRWVAVVGALGLLAALAWLTGAR